jgi:OOP family OmpA-OmpF porin
MLKQALFAAAALAAGAADAQSYVMAGGAPVQSAYGGYLQAGERAAAPLAPVKYRAEVLFAFDDDVLTAEGRKELDQLARKLVSVELDKVVAIGHADDVGTPQYNRRLSARRAKAVGDYLAGKGVAMERLQLVAMGERDSITAGSCEVMNEVQGGSGSDLIACRQPDRRVQVELVGLEKPGD